MGIENFKRWHWMLISFALGAILALTNIYDITSGSTITPDESEAGGQRRTIGITTLVQKLNLPKTDKGYLWLADLTVYPAMNGRIYVSGNELEIQNGKGIYRPFQQITDIPFKVSSMRDAPRADYTIQDYITDVAKQNPDLTYQYAWWFTPKAKWGIWMGISVLVVGILWPTLLGILLGTEREPKPKKQAEKPHWMTSHGHDDLSLGRPKKVGITAADQQQLAELTDKLEHSVGAGVQHSTAAQGAEPQSALAAAVRKLENKPVEAQQIVEAPKEDVDWGGEFYPVAHAKHKKEDEHPH